MSYLGFGKGSGPGGGPNSQPSFGNFPRSASDSPSPTLVNALPPQPHSGHEVWKVQPPLSQNSGPAPSFQIESTGINWGAEAAAKMSVPTPGFQSIKSEGSHPNSAEFHRPLFNTPVLTRFPKNVSSNYSNLNDHRDQSVVQSSIGSYDLGGSFPIGSNEAQATKRTRSPILPSVNNIHHNNSQSAQNNHTRTSVSPPGKGFRSDGNYGASYSNTWSRSSETNKSFEAIATKTTILPIPKRTRSPTLEQDFEGNFNSPLDDSEREIQAKAKRLARFKAELSETAQKGDEIVDENAPVNKQELFMVGKPKFVDNRSTDLAGDSTAVNPVSDYEGLESSGIIIGSCPDMCPESEREERERKGDLDRYERLDGDRNQTNKFLAVKKYTRTAEREASLIRPIAVLQKTIDYLLSLLDQPYDESLLGIYNFLWDRMRAIRMDLRMQHIFNQEAVTMLERMIRLHIIAMHELCEYSKGEGFSEGFDAHLNIEQMNKTSVELFQIYNDHRKKGIHLPSEKDFRGYYALLKLDKHPGYRVEPAELSLDLAKMTPEIRQTPEVLFARDVARACRAGNFIAFFRLARKASYLQACLMHAHFSKLRTQALASLHSGLPNNQGLPVSHVAKWLGMEEEDIESLLEYHGFQLKVFEEPYVVRDGPFLNKDKDYPTKCSKLVHMKKSNRIVVDVSPANQIINLPAATNKIQYPKINKEPHRVSFEKKFSFDASYPKKENSVQVVDEEMPEMETSDQEGHHQVQPPIVTPVVGRLHDDHQIAHVFPAASDGFQAPFSVSMSTPPSTEIKNVCKPSFDGIFDRSQVKSKFPRTEELSFPIVSKAAPQDRSPGGKHYYAEENMVPPQSSFLRNWKDELLHNNKKNKDDEIVARQEKEVAEAKLKLIVRLWKRRSMKKKELREQRILAANTALNLLSMGPPIQLNKEQAGTFRVFDIDCAMVERHKRHQLSWSSLNVSDVVAEKLNQRNPCSKCICWKVVVCSQWSNSPPDNQGQNSQVAHSTAGAWLLSKVMPSNKNDVNLVFTSPGLSIWKKWAFNQSDIYGTCCLSIVKDVKFDNLDETMAGASAILFVISENIPWDLQRAQLHRLVMSIPLGSSLPLLILIGLYHREISDISSTLTDGLSLHKIDKSRVSSFLVVPLVEKHEMELSDGFFSDKQLREGLQWLAEEVPQQPALHTVRTNELILTHLNSSLEVLNNLKDYEVGPDVCISAFNNALDRTLAEVCSAIEGNPTGWPCPEISLLPESSDEQTMVSRGLPTIGWSLPDNVEPLKHALMDLKLPPFPDDTSQLTRSSNMRKEIDICRAHLETCLVRYLTKSSKMLGGGLATKEACIMLQRYAYLEHNNFGYSIVPKWIMIFRRIINWRLMSLTSGVHSFTYVLDSHRVTFPTSRDENSGLRILSPNHLNQPSLDEIIEVSYGTLLCGKDQPRPESNQEIDKVSYLKVDETVSFVSSAIIPCFSSGLEETGRDIVVACRVNKEADNLSMLLEQCNVLQNKIDDKLSVYF